MNTDTAPSQVKHDSLEVTVPIGLLQFHVDNPPQQPAWEWLSIELSTAASAGGQRQGFLLLLSLVPRMPASQWEAGGFQT